jgi:ABC-type branched-subunit amino acid transport system substrate-binding protein
MASGVFYLTIFFALKEDSGMKRSIPKVVFCIVAGFILAFAGISTQANAEPVVKEWKIPFLAFLSGPYAGFGKQIKWAADDAAREINEAGGISGRPIVIEYHDTALDPAKAAAEMSKVVKKSLIIFGPIAATTTKAAMPMVVREKAFAMAVACGLGVNLEFHPWTIHFLGVPKDVITPPLQSWVKRNPDMKTVVQFIWPLDPTWVEFANAQRAALEEVGIEVQPDVELSEGLDMASAVVKAMAGKPDGFTIVVGPVEVAKVIKELDKRGVKNKSRIMIFMTADDPALYEVGKGYLDGAYHWNQFNMASDSPRWEGLYGRYRKAFPEFTQPTIGVPIFYDMVYLAKMAIEKTGATGDSSRLAEERLKIRDFCRNLKGFPGVQNEFDIVDGVIRCPSFLFQIKNNEKQLVESFRLSQ